MSIRIIYELYKHGLYSSWLGILYFMRDGGGDPRGFHGEGWLNRGGKRTRLVGAGVALHGEVFGGKHRTRRGGSGWDGERGPLGRPAEGEQARPRATRATQASPPHASSTPAPTGPKRLPRRHDKKPTPVKRGGWEEGRGRLRRPWGGTK
jgi:hypothetical protein